MVFLTFNCRAMFVPVSLFMLIMVVWTAKADVVPASLAYQNIQIELFTDDDTATPCNDPSNYTITFKNMKLDTGDCVTHLFPQPAMTNGQKWMQFSARAVVKPDSGVQVWLYFTRDEVSGAITYCAEENIQNLPYPLEVSPAQNGVCQIISIPQFQLDPEDPAEQRTMTMRVSYDVVKAAKLVSTLYPSSGLQASVSAVLSGLSVLAMLVVLAN